ncbi:MAG: FMN-binding protein [Pseudomonadales bacterium]|nr:FMN-binding protein [Pseudomonadales bacterium]MCP5182406.1 FMN-binding protein [Pseudomonadales bacterium]
MNDGLRGFLVLALLSVAVSALLAVVHDATTAQVAANRLKERWRVAEALTGLPTLHETASLPLPGTSIELPDHRRLIAAETRGYGGTISILLLVDPDGLRGLRVVQHHETPGVADFIALPDSPWMQQFEALPLIAAASLDTVSGATITTRALRDTVARLAVRDDLPRAESAP